MSPRDQTIPEPKLHGYQRRCPHGKRWNVIERIQPYFSRPNGHPLPNHGFSAIFPEDDGVSKVDMLFTGDFKCMCNKDKETT